MDVSSNISIGAQNQEDVILHIENIFKREALKKILGFFKPYEKDITNTDNKIIIKITSSNPDKCEPFDFSKFRYDDINYISVINRNCRLIERYDLFYRDQDRIFVLKVSKIIKKCYEYNCMELSDIYMIIIYMYYALRYNEPCIDIFNTKFLENNLSDVPKSMELLFVIISGRMIIKNRNVSSLVRTYILGMDVYDHKTRVTNNTNDDCCNFNNWIFGFLNIFCLNDIEY